MWIAVCFVKGDKSDDEYFKHVDELEAARRQWDELKHKGPESRKPKDVNKWREALNRKGKEIRGLMKEMGQKWPDRPMNPKCQ